MGETFTFAHYRFQLLPREPLEMPPRNKGTTIRGGFGTAFRRLVCIDLRLDCAACDLRYTCPYTIVFNPFVPPDAERLSKNQNIPRPFVVKPPLATTTRYLPGEALCFEFVQGLDNATIARRLYKSEKTVANQFTKVYEKLRDWRGFRQDVPVSRAVLIAEFAMYFGVREA
ncbi:MAG: hypothetical protein NZ578_13815 [Candidatus Binatia bacterium]|nr:hypothetical protein [Candidatus Binatia bacterium]